MRLSLSLSLSLYINLSRFAASLSISRSPSFSLFGFLALHHSGRVHVDGRVHGAAGVPHLDLAKLGRAERRYGPLGPRRLVVAQAVPHREGGADGERGEDGGHGRIRHRGRDDGRDDGAHAVAHGAERVAGGAHARGVELRREDPLRHARRREEHARRHGEADGERRLLVRADGEDEHDEAHGGAEMPEAHAEDPPHGVHQQRRDERTHDLHGRSEHRRAVVQVQLVVVVVALVVVVLLEELLEEELPAVVRKAEDEPACVDGHRDAHVLLVEERPDVIVGVALAVLPLGGGPVLRGGRG
mmetsp:Transcript_1086/g.2997  ORF Transcript_1086/g.2997 Transcript_1086/m.2997 type:complete len:300 (+) Transcript_1086:313-1212(+)